jgi:hypothetical protein
LGRREVFGFKKVGGRGGQGRNAFRFFDKFIFPIISGVNYWRSWLFRTQGRGNYG